MIAALLLKYGIPAWLAELVAGAALVLALWAGLAWHDHNVFQRGVAQESARRDVIDKANAAKALAERARLNVLVAAAQAELNSAIANLHQLESELQHEKALSAQRQSDLLAGRERMRVFIRNTERPIDSSRKNQGSPATTMDSRTETSADLSGTTAAAIDTIRAEHNEAVNRLNGCIAAYDAVKTASE